MILGVLGGIASAAVGGIVLGVLHRLQLARRQGAAAVGASFEVPVKLRLARTGHGGRWREGFLSRVDSDVWFRPRKPRPGPRLNLVGSHLVGRRAAKVSERWWFAGRTVVLGDGPLGTFELGPGSDSDEPLIRRVFDP